MLVAGQWWLVTKSLIRHLDGKVAITWRGVEIECSLVKQGVVNNDILGTNNGWGFNDLSRLWR